MVREYLEKLCQDIWHLPTLADGGSTFLEYWLPKNVPLSQSVLKVIKEYHCLPANPRKIKSIAHVIFRLIEKPGLNAVPQEWSEPGRQAMLVVIMACLYQYHPELYRLVEHYPRFYEQLRLWANGDRVEFEHEVFSPRNLQLSLARPPSGADADERRPTPSKAQVDTFPDPVRGNVLRIQSLIRDLGPVPESVVRRISSSKANPWRRRPNTAATATPSYLNPHDDRLLLEYFESVLDWHGYIRFVSLPHYRDNPDIPIRNLFVEPQLSSERISPEQPVEAWPACRGVLDTMADWSRLVVLGDPGTGKSTLVSWLAWQFARPGASPFVERLGPLVPLPMVLRELAIHRGITWGGLIAAFLAHPVAAAFGGRPDRIENLLERGQAFVILDGLDEIGSVEVRKALRMAVFECFDRYPQCRFLLTSR